jgi:hypothetical protein
MALTPKVRAYLRANADWISTQHAPLTEALLMIAQSADAEMADGKRVTGSLMSTYRLTFVSLNDMRPEAVGAVAEDDLLSPL